MRQITTPLRLAPITVGLVVGILSAITAHAETYRIDTQDDFEAFLSGNMPGLETTSLGEISTGYADIDSGKVVIVLSGGDEVLFARGGEFRGAMRLHRGGGADPITIGAHGEGRKPIIDADPSARPAPGQPQSNATTFGTDLYATVAIHDSGGWRVRGLEIRNSDDENRATEPSNTRRLRAGLAFMARDTGRHRDIIVEGNAFRTVYGDPNSKDNGAIMLLVGCGRDPDPAQNKGRCRKSTTRDQASAFDDVLIANNEIRQIDGVGIRIKSIWSVGDEDDADTDITGAERRDTIDPNADTEAYRVASEGLRIIGNRVSDIGKNAMTIGEANGPRIAHNRVGPNIAWSYTGNSIFTFSTDDAVIEYNELWGNVSDIPGDQDRCAIDADFNARRTIIQYNYTHHNNCSIAIMKRYNDGIVIRHNVSENERYGIFYMGFPSAFRVENIHIHHNTFLSDNENMQVFLRRPDPNDGEFKERWPLNTRFENNLIVFRSGGEWGWPLLSATTPDLVATHPQFARADNSSVGNVAIGWRPNSPGTENLSERQARLSDEGVGVRLCKGSPLINGGETPVTKNEVERGFFGEPITETGNIGADAGAGIDC